MVIPSFQNNLGMCLSDPDEAKRFQGSLWSDIVLNDLNCQFIGGLDLKKQHLQTVYNQTIFQSMQGFYGACSTENAIGTAPKINGEPCILDILLLQLVQPFFVIVIHHFLNGFDQNLLTFHGCVACILTLKITFMAQTSPFVGVTGTGAAHFVPSLHVTDDKKAWHPEVDTFCC